VKRGAVVGAVIVLPAIGTASVGDALAAPGPTTPGATTPAGTAQTGAQVLTADQAATLEALLERLIPADANGPGAKEAGVAAYIERGLQGGLGGGLTKTAPLYTAGLPALDAYAKSAYGDAFGSLPPDKQDAVIGDLATGKATGFTPSSATFFALVHEHALQGMFGDPVYGGNQNFAGWKLIRYPGVKMPVPAADQRLNVAVKPALRSTYANGQYAEAKKEAVA
jgi:hypothetical protein